MPASGTYTVRGHGYGHGRGMSQYGAKGAALEGLTHEQILKFYYPGTSLDTARRKIRVLITGDTTSDLVVDARGAARCGTWAPGRRTTCRGTWARPAGGSSVDGQNRNVVAYFADGRGGRGSPAARAALEGAGEFRAGGPITLVTPSAARCRYRGSPSRGAAAAGSTDRNTVNVVSLDDYVQGVVPAEMPASWEPEAVQAQAVAARTYGAYHRAAARRPVYHICDTTSCQVYRGVSGEHELGNAAVRATSRQILTYDGSTGVHRVLGQLRRLDRRRRRRLPRPPRRTPTTTGPATTCTTGR